MASATITGKVEGLSELVARMDGFKKGVKNRALKRGMTKVARLGAKLTKAHLGSTRKLRSRDDRGTGQLKKSIGQKVYMKGGTVVTIIGPRTGFKIQVGTRTRGGKKSKPGDPIYHDPAKIAHLVEFGHAGPHPAPAHPFMRPAWRELKPEVYPIMAREVQVEIEKQAAKGRT